MIQYLAKIEKVIPSDNTFDKAVQKFLQENNRLLINKDDLEEFKGNTIAQIGFMIQENQANATVVRWEQRSRSSDFVLTGISHVSYSIIRIYGLYHSEK